jgi:hypothetical protein
MRVIDGLTALSLALACGCSAGDHPQSGDGGCVVPTPGGACTQEEVVCPSANWQCAQGEWVCNYKTGWELLPFQRPPPQGCDGGVSATDASGG